MFVESKWINYVRETKSFLLTKGKEFEPIIELCEIILDEYNSLEKLGFFLVTKEFSGPFIDDVRDEIFDYLKIDKLNFTVYRNRDRNTELIRTAIQKTIIQLLVVEETLAIIRGGTEKMKAKSFKAIRKGVYSQNDITKLILGRRLVKSQIIDNRLDEIFEKLPSHFQNQIEFLKDLESIEKLETASFDSPPNSYADIFKGNDKKAYELFALLVGNEFFNSYSDFSFIYQKMRNDGLVRNVSHQDFSKWAFDNALIDKKLFDKIEEEGQLRSLRKVDFKNRTEFYYSLKNKLFKNNS